MIPSVVPQPPAPHRASWDCWLTAASTANRVSSLHCVPCHCLALLNGVFICDSASPPTMVHARGTPCTFSIILRKSREHLEQQPPQIVVVRIRALPLVLIPSAWNLFLTLLRYRRNLVPRGVHFSPTLTGLNDPANIYGTC